MGRWGQGGVCTSVGVIWILTLILSPLGLEQDQHFLEGSIPQGLTGERVVGDPFLLLQVFLSATLAV